MVRNINKLREEFYLEEDGSCKWSYVGMDIGVGVCTVCGKSPLKYLFYLQHQVTLKYSIVGSECIQSLNEVDIMKIRADERKAKEELERQNAVVIGKYLTHLVLVEHPEVYKHNWKYGGVRERNFGGSLDFITDVQYQGRNLYRGDFGKAIKRELATIGIEVPNLKGMKQKLEELGIRIEPVVFSTSQNVHKCYYCNTPTNEKCNQCSKYICNGEECPSMVHADMEHGAEAYENSWEYQSVRQSENRGDDEYNREMFRNGGEF